VEESESNLPSSKGKKTIPYHEFKDSDIHQLETGQNMAN
jgi:hypothetical protein